MYRIGVDVGGTFTDVVAVDDDGAVTLAKAPSTPDDQSVGVMDGLGRLAGRLGLSLDALFGQTERIVHGATVATNALLERKGAKVGLLTTEGHRDVLEMREGLKPDRYNMRMPPTPPLIPRRRRLGVKERMRPDGAVEVALDQASLDTAIDFLKQDGVESVAICYLHAYKDPAHERATAEAVKAAMPGVYVTVSADVLPQIKEFERVSTTAVNAYVGPAVGRYLARLESRLQESGYQGPVLIILSHGGVAPVRDTIRLAAGTVLSGPAGGVAGARRSAELLGAPDLIPFDMGGTSTDISLISGGEAALSSDRGVAGERIALPSLDIVSIGAGGGSIAKVDAGGVLHVGPESAGAMPGPACYGRGGAEPTVTDASVVLGLLDAENFLGGAARLDESAAEAALDRLAETLGVDRMTAAEGVHRIVNTTMAEGVRLVSVRRGVDPRRFAMLSFGGAAGVHITEIARALEIGRVFAPRVASVLSAWGMLATDLRFEAARSHIGDAGALDRESLKALFAELEADARARLKSGRLPGQGRRPPLRRHALRRADLRGRRQPGRRRLRRARPDGRGGEALPCAARGAVHLQPAGPGGRAGQRPRRRHRGAARPAAGAGGGRIGPGRAARAPAGLHGRPVGRDAHLRLRRARARPGDRRPRHRRVGNDDGRPAPRRPSDDDAVPLARHRRRLKEKAT